MASRAPAWASYLAVVALGLACCAPLWTGSGILYSPSSDLIAQGAGLRALAERTLAEDGRWPPLWNPSSNAGTPAQANPNGVYLFPLHWLFLLLPLGAAASWVFTLDVLLAGLAMLALARHRLEEPGAALFCAVGYMTSYRFLALIDAGWLPMMTMYSLAPLLFWRADRLFDEPSPRNTAAFAVVLALGAMQGSAQAFYYCLLGLAAFWAWRWRAGGGRLEGRFALAALGGGAVAFLLAAPELLPRFEFMALSNRTLRDYRFFLETTPSFEALSTLLDPRDGGGRRWEYWDHSFYFGLWLYPFALWACWKEPKRSLPLVLACAATLLFCFDSPFLRLMYHALPGFGSFRRPTRVLQLTQLALALLAGLGAQALLRGAWRKRAALAAAVLCALPVLDAGARMLGRFTVVPMEEAFPPPPFHAELRRSPGNGRVAAVGRTAVPYGIAAYHGIDLVNGYEPLNLRHFHEYFAVLKTGDAARVPRSPPVWTELDELARPGMLRALDARWIVANRELPELARLGWEPHGSAEEVPVFDFYRGMRRFPVRLYRDRSPLGPAYFAAALAPVSGPAESLAAIAASTSVLVAHAQGWEPSETPPLDFSGGSARLARRGGDLYEYDVDSRGENFLILSQVWYPGWRARLDGRPARLYRTNHALLGLRVGAGRSRLELEMTSPFLRLGLWFCALGCAAALALALRRRGETV